MPLELSEPQSRILMCNKRNIVVNAGRRFGKSFVSGAKMLVEGTSEYATKRGDFEIWYIAPVADQARNIMWDGWMKKNIPEHLVAYKNEQRMIMRFHNGTTIKIFSADNPDHLVGSGIDLLIIDECAVIPTDEIYQYIRPALSDKHHLGKTLFISTPRGFNWFHDLWMNQFDEGLKDDWESFQFTTAEGGNVTEEEIQKAKKEMSPKKFLQEYYASFETMSNRVYYSYSKEENACQMREEWKYDDIHVGIDFNVTPMTATISHYQWEPNLKRYCSYTFDEYYEPGSHTLELAQWLKKKYPFSKIYAYPDPTGKRKQSSSVGKSDFDLLESQGIEVRAPFAPYNTADKFNTANTALCNANGERSVFIDRDKCPHLCECLYGYSYDEKKGIPDKKGGMDHITDAFAYYLNYMFPLDGGTEHIYRPEVYGV